MFHNEVYRKYQAADHILSAKVFQPQPIHFVIGNRRKASVCIVDQLDKELPLLINPKPISSRSQINFTFVIS